MRADKVAPCALLWREAAPSCCPRPLGAVGGERCLRRQRRLRLRALPGNSSPGEDVAQARMPSRRVPLLVQPQLRQWRRRDTSATTAARLWDSRRRESRVAREAASGPLLCVARPPRCCPARLRCILLLPAPPAIFRQRRLCMLSQHPPRRRNRHRPLRPRRLCPSRSLLSRHRRARRAGEARARLR